MTRTHVIAVSNHPTAPERIEFDVDFALGTIANLTGSGINPEAELMRVQSWHDTFDGTIAFPWQQIYPAKPPLSDPQSLAWSFLARGYQLEGALGNFAPPLPEALPEGALA